MPGQRTCVKSFISRRRTHLLFPTEHSLGEDQLRQLSPHPSRPRQRHALGPARSGSECTTLITHSERLPRHQPKIRLSTQKGSDQQTRFRVQVVPSGDDPIMNVNDLPSSRNVRLQSSRYSTWFLRSHRRKGLATLAAVLATNSPKPGSGRFGIPPVPTEGAPRRMLDSSESVYPRIPRSNTRRRLATTDSGFRF
jgi:hypothetical protein